VINDSPTPSAGSPPDVGVPSSDAARELAPVPARSPSPSWTSRLRTPTILTALAAAAVAVVIGFSRLNTQADEQRTRADRALEELAESRVSTASAREVVAAHEYASVIRSAHREWEAGNLWAMLALLDRTEPIRRGWEWNYLQRLADRSLLTLEGNVNNSDVLSVSFSPDGGRIATAGSDGTAKVWDAKSGKELVSVADHGNIGSVHFSTDGLRIVMGGGVNGHVKIWYAGTGRPIANLSRPHEYGNVFVAFNQDGTRVLTSLDDGTTKLWKPVNTLGNEWILVEPVVLWGHDGRFVSAAFGPEDSRVVTGSADGTARVWDAKTGTELLTLRGHSQGVGSLAFDHEGTRIATGGWDGTARVWAAKTGKELLTLNGHTGVVRSVSFSPDGKRLVTAGDGGTAHVWDATTGVRLHSIKGHRGFHIHAAAFSPDGTRIVTAGGDGTAKVWDAEPADDFVTLIKSDGKRRFVPRAFSPDWTRVATVGDPDRIVVVSEVALGAKSYRLEGHTARIWSLGFSPDGARIVTGSEDKTAREWDAKTGAELLVIQELGEVHGVQFSPDGTPILTSRSIVHSPALWDAKTGAKIQPFLVRGHTSGNQFSPDGTRIVVTTQIHRASICDVRTGEELLSCFGDSERPYDFQIMSTSFSSDGARIVGTCRESRGPGVAKVWDVRPVTGRPRSGAASSPGEPRYAPHGKELLTLRGHTNYVNRAVFSPDGTRIVTCSDDRTAKVWDAATGVELLTLRGGSTPIWSVAFSLDSTRIMTESEDGEVRVWDGRPIRSAVRSGR